MKVLKSYYFGYDLEEITEVMTWAQIGYHTKPCAFFNTNDFFGDFFTFFGHMHKEGFLYLPLKEQGIIDADPVKLIDRMLS